MSTYDDASLIYYPSGYKEDKIYSLKPTDGSGDLTFTRASTATRVNAEGLIEEMPYNKLTYSEQFDNAAWLKVGGAVTANAGVSPNGQTTADRFYIASAASNTRLYANYTFAAQEYTLSVYAKNNGSTDSFRFSYYDGISQEFSSDFSLTNEWQRFTHTFTAATGAGAGVVWIANTSSTGVGSELDLLIWGAQLNIGSTAKPYFPTTDRLNVPRIDYTGGGCGSLLLEKQSTNLALYSEDFSNAVWDKIFFGTGSTIPLVTANYAVSPDGTQNADRLQCTLGSSGYSIIQQLISASGTHTGSVWVKSNTSSNQNIYFRTSSNTTAFVVTPQWQRITLTESAGDYITIGLRDQTGDTNYSCDISIYGAQLESSSYPTSYIPTLASSVTRLADTASKSGISSLIGQTEGVVFVEFNIDSDVNSEGYIIRIDESSFNDTIYMVRGSNKSLTMALRSGGVTIASVNKANVNGTNKAAIGYKSGDFVFYLNGIQLSASSATYTNGIIYDEFILGGFNSSTARMNGNINQALLFKTRLTNDQLADLTGGNKTTFNALAEFYGYQIL